MAEQLQKNWVTITDQETGLQIDFPHTPLEMTFEIPFQNTPPTGKIHLYSAPITTGIFVLSIFIPSKVTNMEWLQKEHFYEFFKTYLVPHLFFNPAIFYDQQVFNYQPKQIHGEKKASFEISYLDHAIVKKIKGIAMIKNYVLYICFYLTSEKDFNQKMLEHFLKSIHFHKSVLKE